MAVYIIDCHTFLDTDFHFLMDGMSIITLGIIGGKLEDISNDQRLTFSLERSFGRLGFQPEEITTIQ